MSEPDNFLTRWSRRKQQAESERQVPATKNPSDVEGKTDEPASKAPAKNPETEFDLSALPPIESITAGTDIRMFLQKGVPAALSRAALRRAWASDPAIRDFIGIAENQWDFAAGSDVAGFGPLEASEEIRQMVASMFKAPADKSATLAAREPEIREHSDPEGQAATANTESRVMPRALLPTGTDDKAGQVEENAASQQTIRAANDVLPTRRRHGGALPD